MPSKAKPVYVYYPDNLGEFLQLRRQKPEALLYAGGTFVLKGEEPRMVPLPQEVISVQWVEELKRVSRSDRYVEIGGACSLARIVEVGSNVLPKSYTQAISTMVPMGILSLATIGGNLCVQDHVLTFYPLLLAAEARIELRRHGNSRWIPAGRLRSAGGRLTLGEEEIVSRVRLPLESWNVQTFAGFGRPYIPETEPIVFVGLAKTDTGVVDDFRLVITAHERFILRSRELEAELIGRRVPVPEREAQTFLRRLESMISAPEVPLSSLQRRRVLGTMRRMLTKLSAQWKSGQRGTT